MSSIWISNSTLTLIDHGLPWKNYYLLMLKNHCIKISISAKANILGGNHKDTIDEHSGDICMTEKCNSGLLDGWVAYVRHDLFPPFSCMTYLRHMRAYD